MPVHLFSVMADVAKVNSIAEEYDISVVEDSAVALGCVKNNCSAGLVGDIGVLYRL